MDRQTILLIDDEEMILDIGGQLLDHLGYNVMKAGTGSDAVSVFEAHADSVDLVILDLILPDLGGGEVFDRIRAVRPDVRVILSSGYSMDGEADEIMRRGCHGFIQKPFNLKQLQDAVTQTLSD
jgi:two-component system, cell cycle sensor histidine kinase and response regulator CckA